MFNQYLANYASQNFQTTAKKIQSVSFVTCYSLVSLLWGLVLLIKGYFDQSELNIISRACFYLFKLYTNFFTQSKENTWECES